MQSGERAPTLLHSQEFRVLLCLPCGYCVLPKALDRHLKAAHGLRKAQRGHLCRYAERLDLADWCDVLYPDSTRPPVSGLPVLDGYACDARKCAHLCVTWKRMEAHWRDAHSATRRTSESQKIRCSPVKLQTFFKGASLRYFVIADSVTSESPPVVNDRALATPPILAKDPDSTVHWLLIKDFLDFSHTTFVPVKGARQSWRDLVVQVSTHADYLRYALLSMSASRIAYQYLESRQQYASEADKLRCRAIESLPTELQPAIADSFFELFNFTRLMTMCCLARKQRGPGVCPSEDLGLNSVLPEHVAVQRQGRALVWPHKTQAGFAHAVQGPLERLTAVGQLAATQSNYSPYDHKLQELLAALMTLEPHWVDAACLDALQLLRVVWATPYRESATGFRDVSLMWTARAYERYLKLVESRDSVAIIIWAHYCVLWSLSEDKYWYMRGHAEMMLSRVVQCLDWEWQSWIAWTIAKVAGYDRNV